MKHRLLGILVAMITVVGLTASPTTAATGDRTPTEIVAAMQPGWNLGNTLDAFPDETSWGNPLTTKALFQKIRSEGFRSVRIPVTWFDHQSTAAPYTVDATWMARVKEVVDLALASDLYVLVNIHHDSWQWIAKMTTDHDGVLARFDAAWTQIAAALRDAPRKVLFESVNEPQFDNATDERKMTLLAELNRSFHGIVRASGGGNADRILVLPTVHTSADQKYLDALSGEIASLNDKNLAATVHFYGYWPFSVNIAGVTTFDEQTQQDLIGYFDRSAQTFVSRGIPVIVGEYGLLSFDVDWNAVQQGEKLKFFEALGYHARAKKLTTMWWDNGQHLDRQTLQQWKDPGLFTQIKSSWRTRSGTTSSDSVFVPKAGAIEPRTLTLNLNGTSFRGLWHGSTALRPGRDYMVSGDQLTLTAAALTRLAGDRSHGVNATLQARFSQGIPWNLYVISYETAVLSDATGTTESLSIPARFNGDRVATMEAKYADGTNAAPHDWTSFKEYGRAYSPDYAGSSIRLLKDLVSQMRDNTPLTLTFHFWSGAKLTYQVTRTGDTVTGTAS